MLRDPASFYERKRSKTLLKVKSYNDDEAVVIGYEDGSGKIDGSVGALKVKTKDGMQFFVGSGLSHNDRRNPPGIG
jgi:DNA ligase-1